MKVLDAAKIARWRFGHLYRAQAMNCWRADRRAWRRVVRNVKLLCEKRGWTLEDLLK